MGYPMGDHRGRALGSRLPVDFATETLANYLTHTIRTVVRAELGDTSKEGRLFAMPRIYNDLLSSQPLCFNLFGELQADLALATSFFQVLQPEVVREVTGIQFEYSPGRGDPRLTGDKSAFDVFVEYEDLYGGLSFFGIEVKYHENLLGAPAKHRKRYDEIAKMMGCFRVEALDQLRHAPLQQIWRDHLLAGVVKETLGYEHGLFVFLYPAGNTHCAAAITEYQNALMDTASFAAWTLEQMTAALRACTNASWVNAFHERYLDFKSVESAALKGID